MLSFNWLDWQRPNTRWLPSWWGEDTGVLPGNCGSSVWGVYPHAWEVSARDLSCRLVFKYTEWCAHKTIHSNNQQQEIGNNRETPISTEDPREGPPRKGLWGLKGERKRFHLITFVLFASQTTCVYTTQSEK